jgi:hypothetical protein
MVIIEMNPGQIMGEVKLGTVPKSLLTDTTMNERVGLIRLLLRRLWRQPRLDLPYSAPQLDAAITRVEELADERPSVFALAMPLGATRIAEPLFAIRPAQKSRCTRMR